ncbi:Hypothetical predicted protein [Mytilus galloprovincialis]|uniref:Tesmin/TSO1-like CXC domain-containing protein n=1 Tax=Mytilus galloprovincialis TaxID=29158 RepID=A0A8B6D2W3_MYTGA|nr:Hypothetical predicted protein [Mytilus galloprovincialis]
MDTLKILSFLQERNPFTDDKSLRNIETGVTAESSVNVDQAKEIGMKIIESMAENKQQFINLLSSKLSEKGCKTFHAPGDADTLIVQTAVSCAANGGQDVVLVGEDTDLLVLLCYHTDMTARNIYFKSDTQKKTAKKFRIWDVKMTKTSLGEETCTFLTFVHAILGCDTTSRVYEIGKGLALKKVMNNDHFKEQAVVFMSENKSKEEVIKAGEEALVCLFGGLPYEGLDILRFRKFLNKVSTGTACVQVHTLPPTSDAARFHSLRVYLQSQTWIDKSDDLNAQEYGWFISDNKLLPTKSVLPPAPEVLLNIIRCNCKQNCDSKRCTCRKHGLDCSISCGECRGVNCSNSPSVTDEDLNAEI